METDAVVPDHSEPDDLAHMLFTAATEIVRQTPRDISLTSVSTLATLARSGPRRITELAAAEGISQPSMTVLVTALADAGHVVRAPDPTDRRASLVSLTESGRAYVRDRRAAGAHNVADMIDRLDPAHRSSLDAALPALRAMREIIATQRDPSTRERVGPPGPDSGRRR